MNLIFMYLGIFFVTIIYLFLNLSSGTGATSNNLPQTNDGNILSIQTFLGNIAVRIVGNPENIPIICLPGINPKLVDEWTIVGNEISKNGYVVYIINFHSNPKTTPSLVYGGISNSDVLRVINDVIKHIQAKQIILMGKSWGGGQAMNFAKEYPTKVQKLCLIAPASSNPSTISQLGEHSFPIYLAWSKDDSTIWYSNSDTWKLILGSKLTFQSAEKGGHRILEEYTGSILKFLTA